MIPLLSLDNGTTYELTTIQLSGSIPEAGLSGTIIDCGIGNPEDFPQAVNGQIALIQRGDLFFSEKVENAMAAGAIAAIIYNNEAEDTFDYWTLGDPRTTWIPSYRITQVEEAILDALPQSGTLSMTDAQFTDSYEYNSGTSMASPMVAGAVAFATMNPDETVQERKARILDTVAPSQSTIESSQEVHSTYETLSIAIPITYLIGGRWTLSAPSSTPPAKTMTTTAITTERNSSTNRPHGPQL